LLVRCHYWRKSAANQPSEALRGQGQHAIWKMFRARSKTDESHETPWKGDILVL